MSPAITKHKGFDLDPMRASDGHWDVHISWEGGGTHFFSCQPGPEEARAAAVRYIDEGGLDEIKEGRG
jgi:hypothetical protein